MFTRPTPNAAVKIREALGCYNFMLRQEPPVPKPKKVRYGDNLKAAFDARRVEARLAKDTARIWCQPLAKAA